MIAFQDWFPYAATGTTFVALGTAKLYGLRKGVVGGRGAPLGQRLCGT